MSYLLFDYGQVGLEAKKGPESFIHSGRSRGVVEKWNISSTDDETINRDWKSTKSFGY